MSEIFKGISQIKFEGAASQNPLSFKAYDAGKKIMGKTMKDHLRFAACYWHTFCSAGSDVFGSGVYNRPWFTSNDPMVNAKLKADAAFEFFTKLDVPYYCFHDTDIAPEGNSLKEYVNNFSAMVDILERKQSETGMKLLWGTANAFSNPRYAAGASTNPNPEVFAYAATQIFHAMNATQRLGGENYVLWGGREGYETLLNTDLKREREQFARLLKMVVEYKYKIGFKGAILIEPKPQEPTKHQYDFDTATVHGFLTQYGLEKEVKMNIEANHATLAGHSFQHEIATAFALDIFGSVDANRGDPQLGWDTDQFPNSVEECTLIMYEILKNGGFTTGGMNFDAHVRRPSSDLADLFYGHIGGMDTMALALEKAAKMLENDFLSHNIDLRYAGWKGDLGRKIMNAELSLDELAALAMSQNLDPKHVSGKQEHLENLVNQIIYRC